MLTNVFGLKTTTTILLPNTNLGTNQMRVSAQQTLGIVDQNAMCNAWVSVT